MGYLTESVMPNHILIIGLLFLGVFLGVCIRLSTLNRLALTAIFSILGYVGAGLFYGYLVGFDSQTHMTCPLCPYILSRGGPLTKFVLYTLISGTVNAVCVIAAGWLIVVSLRSARRWRNRLIR